jgi:hypothetical protein
LRARRSTLTGFTGFTLTATGAALDQHHLGPLTILEENELALLTRLESGREVGVVATNDTACVAVLVDESEARHYEASPNVHTFT